MLVNIMFINIFGVSLGGKLCINRCVKAFVKDGKCINTLWLFRNICLSVVFKFAKLFDAKLKKFCDVYPKISSIFLSSFSFLKLLHSL